MQPTDIRLMHNAVFTKKHLSFRSSVEFYFIAAERDRPSSGDVGTVLSASTGHVSTEPDRGNYTWPLTPVDLLIAY